MWDVEIGYDGDQLPELERAIAGVLGREPDDIERDLTGDDDYHELVFYCVPTKAKAKKIKAELDDLKRSGLPIEVTVIRSASDAELAKIAANGLTPADVQRITARERL